MPEILSKLRDACRSYFDAIVPKKCRAYGFNRRKNRDGQRYCSNADQMRAVFTREKSKVALFMAHDVQLATHQPFFRSLVGKSRSLFSLSEKK